MGTRLSGLYASPEVYADHRAQQQQFETQEGMLAYTDHGQGPAIILIHGVPTSSWMYRKLIPMLQPDFRVIAVDLLGYGSSDKPSGESGVYHHQNQAAYLLALIRQLQLDEYSLLFHDMGGLVAWELMRTDLPSINNLVALNTIVSKQGFNHPDFKQGVFSKMMTSAFAGRWTSSSALKLTFSNMGLGWGAFTEDECYGYVKPMREGGDKALYSFYTGFDSDFFHRLESNRSVFNQFKGNTLVLWGEKDQTLTTKQIPFLQKNLNIPDKNIHRYPDNAHFLAEEMPAEIARQLRGFMLNGVSPAN